jgi:hypothetical protein
MMRALIAVSLVAVSVSCASAQSPSDLSPSDLSRHDLAGCWVMTSIVSHDGLLEEMQANIAEICIPATATGVILAAINTSSCGLVFDIPYARSGNTIVFERNQWFGLEGRFSVQFGKRLETLVLTQPGQEPFIFERS